MAESPMSNDFNAMNSKNGSFICGVVEGFYGRPWTSEQRKDLFQKMKKWGMNSYIYAPKDDSKHRANWRDLYTVEEAEHLTSLITSASEHGITFFYALSPGLDITYSNTKEVLTLKRKLEQVSQFGCTAFALLFDDIDPEMSEADKEVFQSFAHAQVSITNEVFHHLNEPKFIVCPTQYCAARAVPNVQNSEYLTTLGSKLFPEIDIMWTGGKVISRTLTIESIEEITEVLKRPPVIWDNLHANDYDQKRVFLGPYQGRSPDLIPKLRGVVTNPNCEFWANFIAIHTLAQWSQCNIDGDRERNESVCADIKLETETEDGNEVPSLPLNMYHARRALRNAIIEWLPEFQRVRQASGFITKPQVLSSLAVPPAVLTAAASPPIVPPIVVNTCISLTTATTTATSVTTMAPQLSALADVCTTVNGNTGPIVMNSLLSETKVCTEPMDCNVTPSPEAPKTTSPTPIDTEPAPTINDTPNITEHDAGGASKMLVDTSSPESSMNDVDVSDWTVQQLNMEDLTLLCDLFYLPFEHGTQGVQILQEFHWLHSNAHLVAGDENKPEVVEWKERARKLEETSTNVNRLFQKLNAISNKELMYELYPYIWEMRAVISTLNSYIRWLGNPTRTGGGGSSGQSNESPAIGNYTWFSKGWKESFMSGDQEPWVFRGGLTADLQRLIPVDGGSDLFVYKVPQVVSSTIYTIRECKNVDEDQIVNLSRLAIPIPETPPDHLDRLIECMMRLNPKLCFVVDEQVEGEEKVRLAGYAIAISDIRSHESAIEEGDNNLEPWAKDILKCCINGAKPHHPSVISCAIDPSVTDQSVAKRLVICLLAALRANGSCGVFTPVSSSNTLQLEVYSKLGFVEMSRGEDRKTVYLGRIF